METFGVSTEEVVADGSLSPGIVEEEHSSVDTDELLRIYSTLEAMIGVDAVVTVLRGCRLRHRSVTTRRKASAASTISIP